MQESNKIRNRKLAGEIKIMAMQAFSLECVPKRISSDKANYLPKQDVRFILLK